MGPVEARDREVRIGPESYATWRKTSLGATTEAIEQRLILELAGDLSGSACSTLDCGDGALACALGASGANVTGVDADPAMLAAARSRAGREGVAATFVEGRLESLPFPSSSFDVVVAVTVLCFVGDAAGAMREIARLLRSGGRLVFGELGRYSIWAGQRRARGRLGSPTWSKARFRRPLSCRSSWPRRGSRTMSCVVGVLPADRLDRPSCSARRPLARSAHNLRRRLHRRCRNEAGHERSIGTITGAARAAGRCQKGVKW